MNAPDRMAPVWECWLAYRGNVWLGYKRPESRALVPSGPIAWPNKTEVLRRVAELEAKGYDVYFTPAVFRPGTKRMVSADAITTEVLWADLDRKFNLEHLRELPPTWVWATSPGSFQAMWRIGPHADTTPGDLFRPGGYNQALTYYLDADKGGWFGAKFLRVPGTANHKPQYNLPADWRGKVRKMHIGSTFTWSDVRRLDGFEDLMRSLRIKHGPPTPTPPGKLAPRDVEAVMRRLPASLRHRCRHVDAEDDRSGLRFQVTRWLLEKGGTVNDALTVAYEYLDWDDRAFRDVTGIAGKHRADRS